MWQSCRWSDMNVAVMSLRAGCQAVKRAPPGSNGAEEAVAGALSGVGVEDEVAVHAAEPVGGRVGRERVAEVSGPDLADPLVVLVLVVDQGGQQVGGDDR